MFRIERRVSKIAWKGGKTPGEGKTRAKRTNLLDKRDEAYYLMVYNCYHKPALDSLHEKYTLLMKYLYRYPSIERKNLQ